MNHDWRKIAAQRFIGIAVHGMGRFCVLGCDRKACWLVADEATANGAALGGCYMSAGRCQCRHVVLDLMPRSCPEAPRCKDVGYSDRDERRKYGQ